MLLMVPIRSGPLKVDMPVSSTLCYIFSGTFSLFFETRNPSRESAFLRDLCKSSLHVRMVHGLSALEENPAKVVCQ